MKKIISMCGIMGSLLIAMLPGVSSCDKLGDELFKRDTYIIHNGWQDYSLEVADDSTTILPVYFGVNGTSGSDREIHITTEADPDTLDTYSKDKYKSQTGLCYKISLGGTYTFDTDSWNIKSGESNAAAYIHIDLNKVREVDNLYNDYVLPLRITSSAGGEMGANKYTKVLAHIGFKNDYSGTYSGKGVVTQQGTTYATKTTSTQFCVINNNICYTFIGGKARSNTADYLNHVVEIERDDFGNVTLASHVDGLKFKPCSAKLSRKYTYNYTDQRYYMEITTIELTYEYQDSVQGGSLMMSFEGTFSVSRDVLRVSYPNVDVEE